mmetsp:Transcript_39997/g.80168  ORF Transcript_39997/g.80168 Transcript_39997/m.80168 type:complete len:131 (-) Transcript_39997:313-705(-)
MGKKVPFAPGAEMADGLLDLVLVTRSGGLDILHANARARGGTHKELPFVEVQRCRSFTLRGSGSVNLDGEIATCSAPFRASCIPNALEVFASRLNTDLYDTSAELEPRLVLGLVDLLSTSNVQSTAQSAF